MKRLLVTLLLLVVWPLAAAAGASSSGLRVAATINGRDVTTTSGGHPLRLDPSTDAVLGVTVTNPTAKDVTIDAVRIEGEVGGVTFYSYQVAINMVVTAGGSQSRQVTVNLDGLQSQATGLMAGKVQFLAAHNKVVGSVSMITDVRGSAFSTYSVCGMVVLFLTLLGFLSALVALARHRLPENRFVRAGRFGGPALGAGLFVVFLLSAFRVVVPRLTSGVPIVLLVGVIGYGVGYLTPTPEGSVEEYDEYEEWEADGEDSADLTPESF